MGKSARMDAQLTIFFRSVIAQGIEHSARLLRGGGIVKVNQRLAVDLLVEDGKVGPDGCPVNHLLLLLRRGCFSDHNHFRAAPTVAWPVRSSCPRSEERRGGEEWRSRWWPS